MDIGYFLNILGISRNDIYIDKRSEKNKITQNFEYDIYSDCLTLNIEPDKNLIYDNTKELIFNYKINNINELIGFFNQDKTGFSDIFTTSYDLDNKNYFKNKTQATHTINFSNSTINSIIGWINLLIRF